MNSKEALKDFQILVGDYKNKWDKKTYDHFVNTLDIIKTDLDRLEKLEKEHEFLGEHYRELSAYSKKQDKILRIIKEKQVNVGYLLACDDYEEYLDYFNDRQGEGNLPSFELLTQEEFDLLKEYFTKWLNIQSQL